MKIKDWIDQLLELTVIGSFTRTGPAIRRRLFDWQDPPQDALRGRTALVTGPTSGLGRATASALAALGARVVLVGRNEPKLERVRGELMAEHGEDRFPIVVADMESLASIRAAVARLLNTEDRIDVLVDNAGAIFPDRRVGPDGIEATLAVLVVGPFALIGGLMSLLQRTSGSRVISIASGGMYTQALDLDDLQWETETFSGAKAYARAKRAQVSLIREWARRFDGTGVTFHAMHPGWADTPGLAETLPGFYRWMGPLLRSIEQGIDSITWLATASEAAAANGGFVLDRRTRPFDRVPATRVSAAERRRLWDIVVELSGSPDPSMPG